MILHFNTCNKAGLKLKGWRRSRTRHRSLTGAFPLLELKAKTLKWKDWETARLSCTKQMGSARSSMRTTHPFHCPPEMLIYFALTVNLVGGATVVCIVSLLINRVSHTTPWASQTSADHKQGAWSVSGAHPLVKRCAHFIVPLLGNAQYGIAYFFIYTK